MSAARIVAVAEWGELRGLEGLASRIFGAGDRPRGWFERKLAREAVDARLSRVALVDGDPYGYVLVGSPQMGLARTAGVGVAPQFRGRGIGNQLVEAACVGASQRGLSRIRTLAEPERVEFYRRLRFVVCRTNHSLLNFATGEHKPDAPARAWDDVGACIHEFSSWMQTAWDRTPTEARLTLRITDHAVAHVSREGEAYLVHRLTGNTRDENTIASVTRQLLATLEAPRPVLLYGCDSVSCVTSSLRRDGWSVAQTASVMERPL